MKKKPVIGDKNLPESRQINVNPPRTRHTRNIPTGSVPDIKWTFSFQYFGQAHLFGLDQTDANWLAGFLERLRDLSGKSINEVARPGALHKALRYHKIDWNHRNTPVDRQHFNWLPKAILNNEDEFPFVQFAVSKALGRIVGFWDPDSVFQILVVDRNHNLQPSKKHNWQIRNTFMIESEFDKLRLKIDAIKNRKCEDPNCSIRGELHSIETCMIDLDIFILCLDEAFANRLHEIRSPELSIRDILEHGILANS